MKEQPHQDPTKKRPWSAPRLAKFGRLSEAVQANNPGKSDFGLDGMGMGGGEEMFMF
jgi:hypothetical protein